MASSRFSTRGLEEFGESSRSASLPGNALVGFFKTSSSSCLGIRDVAVKSNTLRLFQELARRATVRLQDFKQQARSPEAGKSSTGCSFVSSRLQKRLSFTLPRRWLASCGALQPTTFSKRPEPESVVPGDPPKSSGLGLGRPRRSSTTRPWQRSD